MAYGTALQQRLYYSAPAFCKNLMSSYYGWLQRRDRHGEFYRRHLGSLMETQWYDNERLRELQFGRIKDFLLETERQSPFYRRLFREHDFEPAAMRVLSDLTVLPILDKETVRDRLQEITPRDVRPGEARWVHTSGTTGMGLRFLVSKECFQREYAFRALHYLWGGIREGENYAFCSGHPVAHQDRRKPPFWVRDLANNWLLLSSYHLTEENLPRYIEQLDMFRPALLGGYPSSLYLLALANRRLGRRVHPRAVFAASETLFDYQREAIESSFGCQVFLWYGNTEMCGNIVECEQGRYHLKLEHSYVELLGPDNRPVPAGCEGKMVVTGFGNAATPLVRYAVGDVAVRSKVAACDCGRGGVMIERVVGRTEDYVLTPDGRFVGRLDHLFKDAVRVKQAQIVQNKIEEILLRIVKERDYTTEDEREILREARVRLGSGVNVKFEYVDEIERTTNGKFRFIVSNLKQAREAVGNRELAVSGEQ